MNYEICVIGNTALLYSFLQYGFTTFAPSSETQLREYLQEVIDKNYGIVYIEDSLCPLVEDILDKHVDSLTPIFIPIGDSEEGESFSQQMVKKMMERAIGTNIL